MLSFRLSRGYINISNNLHLAFFNNMYVTGQSNSYIFLISYDIRHYISNIAIHMHTYSYRRLARYQ